MPPAQRDEALELLRDSNKWLTEQVVALKIDNAVIKNSLRIYVALIGIAWGAFGAVVAIAVKAWLKL